jgi:hypothetical protein
MERRDGCPVASYLAEEAPGRRPADVRLQALTAWDALADVRRDATGEPLVLLEPQQAACVGKSADPAQGDPAEGDSHLRWEPQAAR